MPCRVVNSVVNALSVATGAHSSTGHVSCQGVDSVCSNESTRPVNHFLGPSLKSVDSAGQHGCVFKGNKIISIGQRALHVINLLYHPVRRPPIMK